jgi:hypothetical protein
VFTARYALSPYIKQIRFVFKGLILYLTLVRLDLECASTVWNSITYADAKKLERVQRKFVALCQNRLFTHDNVTHKDFLKFLKIHTLQYSRLRLDALFVIYVYSGL